jgi:hypothetical protein
MRLLELSQTTYRDVDPCLDFISNEIITYLKWDCDVYPKPSLKFLIRPWYLSRSYLDRVLLLSQLRSFYSSQTHLSRCWYLSRFYLEWDLNISQMRLWCLSQIISEIFDSSLIIISILSRSSSTFISIEIFLFISNPLIDMVSLISNLSQMGWQIISNETVILIPIHLRNFWIEPYFYLNCFLIGMIFISNEIGFFHLNRDKFIRFFMNFISFLSRFYLDREKIFLSILSQNIESKMSQNRYQGGRRA